MGQALSSRRETVQEQLRVSGEPILRNSLEQLDFLNRMANSKLDIYEANLNSTFRDPGPQEKVQIVGTRALKYERRHIVDVSQGVNLDYVSSSCMTASLCSTGFCCQYVMRNVLCSLLPMLSSLGVTPAGQ